MSRYLDTSPPTLFWCLLVSTRARLSTVGSACWRCRDMSSCCISTKLLALGAGLLLCCGSCNELSAICPPPCFPGRCSCHLSFGLFHPCLSVVHLLPWHLRAWLCILEWVERLMSSLTSQLLCACSASRPCLRNSWVRRDVHSSVAASGGVMVHPLLPA